MSALPPSGSAQHCAQQLVDAAITLPEVPPELAPLALAWALKDLCYAAWSSSPQRATRAAQVLADLSAAATHAAGVDSAARQQIQALASWTAGIAQLIRGHMADAVHCFDSAGASFRQLTLAGPAAQTQVPKIMALSMLGEYQRAADCAEHAQRQFVQLGDLQAAGKVSLNLGALNERRGCYTQAANHSRVAAVYFARVGDHEHSVMADINMANALMSLGDFDEALRIYARARRRAERHRFPVLETLAGESLALLQLTRGEYRDALAGFEQARRRYEQLAMPQQLAVAEKQLADAYLELRLLPEAVALFGQVLLRFESLNVPDEQAWTLTQLGRAQALLGQHTQADQAFAQAAALFATQANGAGAATVTLARAELALAAGDGAHALALAREAERGFAAGKLADARLRADVVCALAQLHAGACEQARALFDATQRRAEEMQLLTVQVRCLTGAGLAAQALAEPAAAHAAYSAAVTLFEDQRRALPGDELRNAFLTDHLRPYQELLRAALHDHQQAPSAGHAAEVLRQLDRIRARSLNERLAEPAGDTDDATLQALRERVNWLSRRVQRMDDEGEPSAALSAELRSAEQTLLEHARRVRLGTPQAAAAAAAGTVSDATLDVATLCAALGADAALIEFGVLEDELFACVVTQAGVCVQRHLAAWGDVLEALRAARFQIDTLRHGAAALRQHLPSLTQRSELRMRRLHGMLWAPLTPNVAHYRRVLVVPHAQLGWLPFAALHDGANVLAYHHEIAVVPNARLALRGLARPLPSIRHALVLGESSHLPNAAHEAHFVAGLLPASRVCIDAQATLGAVHTHAGSADVIHLACHGQFRSDNPMFSALHLHDGALTAEAVQALPLGPALVVLSACETGLSEHSSGDEMVGLVRAFLVAGAARVLASLWTVDDAVTALFMANFYSALCRGATPAAALRTAQLHVRQRHPHPFYWAAFTLHGGW